MKQDKDVPLIEDRPKVRVYAVRDITTGFEQMGNGYLQIVTDAYENHFEHYIEVKQFGSEMIILRSHLLKQHNFEVQQDSVICWVDPDHPQCEGIAVSFESSDECDIYWRLICCKIGKNYLQINGNQTLQMPTELNMNYIMSKVKSSFKMIAYNILNNNQFLDSLQQVFNKMKARNDEMGIGMVSRIVKAILTSYDIKVLDCLLGDRHFGFFLRVNKYQTGIDFPAIYQNKIRMRILLPFPPQIAEKINIVHRSLFCRQCILDLSKQFRLESMLKIIVTDKYADIITYLIHGNVLKDIVELDFNQFLKQTLEAQPQLADQQEKALSNDQEKEPKNGQVKDQQENTPQPNSITGQSLNKKWSYRRLHSLELNSRIQGHEQSILKQWKIDFMLEALNMVKQVNGERTKKNFFNMIYECKILKPFENLLQENYPKSIDIFNQMAQSDNTLFIDFLRGQFRDSPSANLHRRLVKKYCSAGSQFQNRILQLLETLSPTLRARKDYIEFYSGTFLVIVFEQCQRPIAITNLILLFLQQVPNSTTLFNLIIKHKIFQKIAELIHAKTTKTQYLGAVKVIRTLARDSELETQTQKLEINRVRESLVESQLIDRCIDYFRKIHATNNIISSTMLETFKVIGRTEFNVITQYFQRRADEWPDLEPYLAEIKAKKRKINNEETEAVEYIGPGQNHLTNLEREQEEKYFDQDQSSEMGKFFDKPKEKTNLVKEIDEKESVKRKNEIQAMMDEIKKKAKTEEEEQAQKNQTEKDNSRQKTSEMITQGMLFSFEPPEPDS